MRFVGAKPMKALSVPLAALALLAAGCGSSSSHHAATTTGSTSAKTGVSATFAVSALPTSADLDPKSEADSVLSQNVGNSVAGTLFGYNGSSVDPDTAATFPAPDPALALSATPSANGLTWTFKLRPHVVSQDGNPLTAADVVYTIKRALHSASSGANLLKGIHIDAAHPATATGPLTVQVHLSSPSSLVVKTFSVSYLGILDEKAIAAHSPASDPWGYTYLRSHSAGFGPYEVSIDELPTKEVITANPHYFGGTPQITKATFTQIADDGTRLEAAISGQVDYAVAQATNDLPKVKASSAVQADLQHVPLQFYLVFVMKSPLVQNALVRRALTLAVNRQEIAKIAYQGAAEPVTSCVPQSLYAAPASLANANPATGDVAKAKQLYAAGHGPKSIVFGYPTVIPGAQSLAEVVQSDFQALGVKTTLMPFASYSTFVADEAAGKFPVALGGFGPNVVDPGYFLYTLADSHSSYNLGGYSNPALNAALNKAETVSGAARVPALAAACKLALAQAPVGPLVSADNLGVASRKFSVLSSLGGVPLPDNMRMR
jgi:peptide/nickel transport system substrate-binding protein